ncbi:MAG: hypothetical protein DMF39_07415 [Verrucomicrobia bacterium]|nr:MAG: hypothetical protein DMF39_07415 [Verrucomicrobiota bacterium]
MFWPLISKETHVRPFKARFAKNSDVLQEENLNATRPMLSRDGVVEPFCGGESRFSKRKRRSPQGRTPFQFTLVLAAARPI